MIKQTKKKVFALVGMVGLIGRLSMPTVAQAPSIPEQSTESEVAEQKSVIDEQNINIVVNKETNASVVPNSKFCCLFNLVLFC